MPSYEFPRPSLTVDIVLFRGTGDDREVLLVRRSQDPFARRWALPGGFVDEQERLEDAARRELSEETGVRFEGRLEQFWTFGDPGRDPRGWTVSVAFRGEADAGAHPDAAGADDAEDAAWRPLRSLPPLAFDHDLIVRKALEACGRTPSDSRDA